jgi:hypothetical protein
LSERREQPWRDYFAGGVDGFRACRHLDIVTDRRDAAVDDQYRCVLDRSLGSDRV